MDKKCKFKSNCIDCGVDTFAINEYYMLKNDVWYEAVPIEKRGCMLCIQCVERRLGRELNANDFNECLLNEDIIVGIRAASKILFDRITR